MSMRAALLTTEVTLEPSAMRAVLRDLLLPVHVHRISPRLPFRALLRLLRYRPDLVVTDAGNGPVRLATLYRLLRPRSRLLLCGSGGAAEGWLARVARRWADALVSDTQQMLEAIGRLDFPDVMTRPMKLPDDLDLFAVCPVQRDSGNAHRLIHAGELSPESGVSGLFACLVAWAEEHPHRTLEICWLGEGDLSGVLRAQPLPANLVQRFEPPADRVALLDAFARSGILLVTDPRLPLAAEGLAAGLVVVAGRSETADGTPLFGFDPAKPGQLMHALSQVLDATPADLDALRVLGRGLLPCGAAAARADA